MLLEPLLDLHRVDVLAPAQDQVALAGSQVEPTALHSADVAGAQPATREQGRGRRFGIAKVLLHHHRTTDVDLALAALGQGMPLRVSHLELHGRNGSAARVRVLRQLHAGIQGRKGAGFGESVAHAERALHGRHQLAPQDLQSLEDRRATAADQPQRGEIVRARPRVMQQAMEQCRRVAPARHALALDQRECQLGVEPAHGPHGLTARGQRDDGSSVQTGDMEERTGHQRAWR